METTNIENAQTIEEVTKEVAKSASPQRHMNRAQRRAAAKRAGKKGRKQIDVVSELLLFVPLWVVSAIAACQV